MEWAFLDYPYSVKTVRSQSWTLQDRKESDSFHLLAPPSVMLNETTYGLCKKIFFFANHMILEKMEQAFSFLTNLWLDVYAYELFFRNNQPISSSMKEE